MTTVISKSNQNPGSITKSGAYMSPISVPLVTGKLEQKVVKLLKKTQSAKALKRGVPEVTKFLRKDKKGIVVLAGDVFPIELIAHLPILCEEKDVFYCYLSSRAVLAEAVGSKRLVSVVFIPTASSDSPYESLYGPVLEGLKEVHPFMGKGKWEGPNTDVTLQLENGENESGNGNSAESTDATSEKKEKKSKKRDAADDVNEETVNPTEDGPAKKKKKKEKKE